MIIAATGLAIGISESRAQVPLSSYADANGYLDVHKLTCEQLVNSSQQDADSADGLVRRLVQWACP
jgi:hypothetical protein